MSLQSNRWRSCSDILLPWTYTHQNVIWEAMQSKTSSAQDPFHHSSLVGEYVLRSISDYPTHSFYHCISLSMPPNSRSVWSFVYLSTRIYNSTTSILLWKCEHDTKTETKCVWKTEFLYSHRISHMLGWRLTENYRQWQKDEFLIMSWLSLVLLFERVQRVWYITLQFEHFDVIGNIRLASIL